MHRQLIILMDHQLIIQSIEGIGQNECVIQFIIEIIFMKCPAEGCPPLYFCENEICIHQGLNYLSPNIFVAILLAPILAAISNRLGLSSIWIIYPISMLLMCYHFSESFIVMAPFVLSSSLVSAFMAVGQKNQESGSAANYYIINTTIPVFVVGFHIGLKLSSFLPYAPISLLAVLLAITFLMMYIREYKEIRADEKIADGHFRKLLPARYQSPRKERKQKIQMTKISQADSEYQVNEKHLTPSRKSQIRMQLQQNLKTIYPASHFVVAFMCFVIFQSLCLSFPPLLSYLGVENDSINIIVAYVIMLLLAIIAQFYLYKFYIEPVKIQEQQIKLNLGLQLNGSQMIKICVFGFFGSLLEGSIGFGFSQIFILYLLFSSKMKIKSAFATSGFFTLFFGLILTFNRIFCDHFSGLSYLATFSISLGFIILFQYVLNTCILNNISESTMGSTLLVFSIIVQAICLTSVIAASILEWNFFGAHSFLAFGVIKPC